uniref:Transmembrane protein n=1 Tax=Rhabditophanes sp. KR3021 TaxID=114890 RepID=A0AC35TTL9_9BILA
MSLSDYLNSYYTKKIEADIKLHELINEREKAIEIASSREMFGWHAMGASTLTAAFIFISQITKNKLYSLPIVCIVMTTGYQYEKIYGDHQQNVKKAADLIFLKEQKLLKPIGGALTLKQIDDRINHSRE